MSTILRRRSLYDILGVSPHASKQEIKAQFYRLSLLYHPDTAADDPHPPTSHDKFLQISQAYAILANDLQRQAYDREHHIQPTRKPKDFATGKPKDFATGKTKDFASSSTAESMARWTRWTYNSASHRTIRSLERKVSSDQQKDETVTMRNRLLAMVVSIVVCVIISKHGMV